MPTPRYTAPMNPSQYVGLIFLSAIAVAGCFYVYTHTGRWGFDDAFISYRYALNFVAGHGLVFNPGEYVEGYSNFLYVMLMAFGLVFVDMGELYVFSFLVNIAFVVGALWLFHGELRREFTGARLWGGALLFAACPLFWRAAWSGMETVMVLFLFMLLWRAVRRVHEDQIANADLLLGAACALIVLARADGFVVTVITAAYFIFTLRWRAFAVVAGATAVTFGAQVFWRMVYYGYPLPNTVYAKVSGPLPLRLQYGWRLLRNLEMVHAYLAVILLVAAVGALVIVFNRRDPRRLMPFEVFFALSWLAYWLYIGGDIFRERFLLILVPLAVYLFVRHIVPAVPMGIIAAVLGALILVQPFRTPGIVSEGSYGDSWRRLGLFLGDRHPDALIAVDAAGKIPYFSELRAIDMLGLTDEHIGQLDITSEQFAPGHNKSDVAYVLGREPDLITGWAQLTPFGLGDKLSYEMLRGAGYEFAYMVHDLDVAPRHGPIVSAPNPSTPEGREAMQNLMFQGYRYAVLARRGYAQPVE